MAIVVSQYHERVTSQLLAGALQCCTEAGLGAEEIDVLWVPGAFELGVAIEAAAASKRYACVVALGAVIRGETPHFDFVAGEAARALAGTAISYRIPVGFGLLTTDTLDQARARAGGSAGNKGYEAAEAAIATADLLRALDAPGQ